MFNYFRQNNIFTVCQSGFILAISCVAQLLSITQEIYQCFDCSPTRDIIGVFFNIFKVFDNVWHEGWLFKLQSYGIKWSLLRSLKNGLTVRLQTVVLNGQTSSWLNVTVGVPQGFVLGSVFFFLFIEMFCLMK